MKHRFFSIMLCLTLAFSYAPLQSSALADDIPFTLNPVAMKSNRPKLLVENQVTCYYRDGWLYIEFDNSEGLASLTIRNEEGKLTTWRPFGSWHVYKCYLGEIEGALTITVKTTAGNAYQGVLLGNDHNDYSDGWDGDQEP